MFAQLQDILKAMDISDNSTGNGSQRYENYLRKLSSLSRYVTPCPDILDDVGSSNNNPSNTSFTSASPYVPISAEKSSTQGAVRGSEYCPFPECNDSDNSDESSWESLQTPTHTTGQWKNLLEYEESLLANHTPQTRDVPSHVDRNNLSVSRGEPHQTPQVRYKAHPQAEDVVKVLNSIERSLEKLQGHGCVNATDGFGRYVAHRLSEMPPENRSAAEVEINRVLMKYVTNDIKRERESTPSEETPDEDEKKYKGKRNKQIIKREVDS